MQTCYNCGKQVDDNVLICPDCGALVRRYTSAPAREVPAAPAPAPQPPQDRPAVWRDEISGRVHLKGGLMFWVVLCAILAGYYAFGSVCALLLYYFQDFYLTSVQAFEELAPMASLMQAMIQTVEAYLPAFFAMAVLLVVKLIGYILFAVTKRRAAVYIVLAGALLAALVSILTGAVLQAVLYLADAVVTVLLLRKHWAQLR